MDVQDHFNEAMRALGVPAGAKFAVAVSGGGDSMACALLAQGYLALAPAGSAMALTPLATKGSASWPRCNKSPSPLEGEGWGGGAHPWNDTATTPPPSLPPQGGEGLVALTVDHSLRPESAAEARQVGAWMAARGIEHQVLTVSVEKPSQAAAREARYAALLGWCRTHDVRYLLLGHHALDQAETVAIRHVRGSGPEGLAGMREAVEREGITLLRPLLDIAPERLREYLQICGQGWIEDPSNQNLKYDRARLRSDAFDREGWLALQGEAATKRAAWESRIDGWMARHANCVHAQALSFDPAAFAAAGPELRWRLLREMLMGVAGLGLPPRTRKLQALADAVAGGLDSRRTLAGCVVLPWRGRVWVCREPARLGAESLGAAGLKALKAAGRWRAGHWPREAWLALPASQGAAIPY